MKNEPTNDTELSPEERISLPSVMASEQMPEVTKFADEIPELQVGLDRGEISDTDLSKADSAKAPEFGFRPKWLNLCYHPQIVPRYRRLRSGVQGSAPEPHAIYRGELLVGNNYPYCTIGKVFVYGGFHGVGWDLIGGGSGVLVGPNIMLTAAHVLPWNQSIEPWGVKFVPAFRFDPAFPGTAAPFGHSWVSDIRRPTSVIAVDTDYAVCKLKNPIGNNCGWMQNWGSRDDEFYEDRWWDSVGYPDNFYRGNRPAVEWNQRPESADEDDGKVQIHFEDRFTSDGWSGGPLFGYTHGAFRVVAVCTGGLQDFWWEWDSVFSGGPRMVDLIGWAWDNWV